VWVRRLARGEQALDAAELVGEFCDVGLGGALLGWLQRQYELPSGLQAPEADFADVAAVLEAYAVAFTAMSRFIAAFTATSGTAPTR
jgi:hypothetical protein